mmetsp:Transcript_22904/g.42435  ORF Transcript_22904/g.42435 Transcript_22904/m.42435 type:complete len:202 (+) Transcript_22904:91-696(+)
MATQPSASLQSSPWAKVVHKHTASSLRVALSDYNSKVTKLQSQAQSPPVDISERAPWAKKLKEDALKLAANFTELAGDALEADCVGFAGATEIRTQVADALERCANCANAAELALLTWSLEQTFQLGTEDELDSFGDKAQVLNKSVINSVSQAIKQLNAGDISCPEGYCVVYSSKAQAYYALYRSDKKDATLTLFNYKEAD